MELLDFSILPNIEGVEIKEIDIVSFEKFNTSKVRTPQWLGGEKEKIYSLSELKETGFIISTESLTEKEWEEKADLLQDFTGMQWNGGQNLKEIFPRNEYNNYIGAQKHEENFFLHNKNYVSKRCVLFDSIDEFLTIVSKED